MQGVRDGEKRMRHAQLQSSTQTGEQLFSFYGGLIHHDAAIHDVGESAGKF